MGGRSAAHNYIQWNTETNFKTFPNMTRVFGFETKLGGVTPNQNLLTLQGQNANTIQKFGFGQFDGSYSLEWVISNPWFLELLFGKVVTTGASAPFTHTFTNEKTKKTFSLEDGFDGSTSKVVRKLLGSIMNETTISSSLNSWVRARANCLYALEATPTTALDTSIPSDDLDFPYTMEYASLELPSGTPIAEVQTFDLTINPRGAYIFGQNSKEAVQAWWGQMTYEGRLSATVLDASLLQKVLDRTEVASIKIVLTNKLTAANEKSITFNGTGVGLGSQSQSFNPNELVLQDVPFSVREMTAVAINPISAIP